MKEFTKFNPRTVKTKSNMKIVYKNARELYSKLLSIYYNDDNDITDEEKKDRLKNIILKIYLPYSYKVFARQIIAGQMFAN